MNNTNAQKWRLISAGNGYYYVQKTNLGTYTVKKGELIGYVGSTGNSTGPHLHFEFYINNKRVEPTKYVKIN